MKTYTFNNQLTSKNLKSLAASKCNGKTYCNFIGNNDHAGDPCSANKYTTIAYNCITTKSKFNYPCENSGDGPQPATECFGGKFIQIESAYYGRTVGGSLCGTSNSCDNRNGS